MTPTKKGQTALEYLLIIVVAIIIVIAVLFFMQGTTEETTETANETGRLSYGAPQTRTSGSSRARRS